MSGGINGVNALKGSGGFNAVNGINGVKGVKAAAIAMTQLQPELSRAKPISIVKAPDTIVEKTVMSKTMPFQKHSLPDIEVAPMR